MTRVLLVLGSSAGGVARHVAQVGEALAGPPVRADVVVAGPTGQVPVLDPAGRPLRTVPVPIGPRPGVQDLRAARTLRRLARAADVVHAHGLRAGALAVLAARSLPAARRPRVVVTLHNLPVGGRWVRSVSAVLELVVVRGADAVLGVSGDLVARARRRGARRAERALVPAPGRACPGADPAAVRRGLGLPDGPALVVTVARLAPQKGLELLVDAARRLTVPAVWVVAGEGPLRPWLAERIAAEHLDVRLLGQRDDVVDLFGAADVVVSAARWEGQPLGVQEALRAGAALVATDVGGTREVTGPAAVLVPFGDPAALARAVDTLLRDAPARAALRSAAVARADQLPDVADVVAQLRRVYRLPGDRRGAGGEPRP